VQKGFYVTTPIYYVNGLPHIGHAYTTIAADTITRWHRLRGRDAFFLTGTDEHGQKVLEKARERGMTPIAHCDDMVVHWKAMMARLDVRYDRFFRTTDADHVQVVQRVLQDLKDRGLVERRTYDGWYHVADEIFVTDKDIEDGKYDKATLQRISEPNWFFLMSRYQQQLIAHIEANPGFIQPESRKNEVLGFLRKPLGDLCISRPKARMSWGIPIPFDEDFVTYVWFDALLNYLTGCGFHADGSNDHLRWWPADFQLLGKDILTTHAVYWSTMLMAMGVPLPKTLFAHGWWTSGDGQKMSKSKGNTIDVMLLADSFGVDATRYFLLREIAFGADGGFTYDGFMTRYNGDLANDLGNLAHRGLSMTTNWLGGTVPASTPGPTEEALRKLVSDVSRRFEAAIERLQFRAAFEAVGEIVQAGNGYIEKEQPWALNKKGDPRLATVLRTVLELTHAAALLLLPVMPARMAELLRRLGRADADPAATIDAILASGATMAALPVGTRLDVGDPLFPRFKELPPAIAALFAPSDEAPPAPPPPPAAEKSTKAEAAADPGTPITYDDFARVKLRAGKIVAAERHPKADKLLVLQVDVGEGKPRQIVAGIAAKYAPEVLVGRQVVVVVNLAPAKLRGIESQGMLLAAGGADVVDLVAVNAAPGEVVR
jgi:methionyl-tRNA synthetase